MSESYTLLSFMWVGFVCWVLRGYLHKHYFLQSSHTCLWANLQMFSVSSGWSLMPSMATDHWTFIANSGVRNSIWELNFKMIEVFLPCISFFIIDINTCLSVSSSWMCQTCTHNLPCLALSPSLPPSLPLRFASWEMACKQVASDEKIAHLSQQVKWHCLGTTCQMQFGLLRWMDGKWNSSEMLMWCAMLVSSLFDVYVCSWCRDLHRLLCPSPSTTSYLTKVLC